MSDHPSSPHGPVRFLLVGGGMIGNFRAAALAKVPGARLEAVADVREESAKSLAGRYGVKARCDVEAAVADADIDAVLVCTPPNTHRPLAIAALAAGKHVLCEKP